MKKKTKQNKTKQIRQTLRDSRKEQFYERRSSQLSTQLLQMRNESLKKIQACTGFEPLTSAIHVQRSTS